MLNPLKPKFYPLYMDMAKRCAEESYAKKRKIGSVLVTPSGLISIGWNGMPPGHDNVCEYPIDHPSLAGKTKPQVIHAERNSLDKLSRTGLSSVGGVLFITHSPCMECAKSVLNLGIKEVWYLEEFNPNPDSLPDSNDYTKHDGRKYLEDSNVSCKPFNPINSLK